MESFSTSFAHIDMDAFYVEVERLDDPSLMGLPVVVGGLGPRGVVASASYEARRRGVRSAMPIVEARRRLPHGRFVPPSMAKYSEVSRQVFAILEEFTPYIEPLSIDEAFLDIRGLRLHYESPLDVATAIRRRIRDELQLPASVGVAAVKFLAKMASKRAKPDGTFVIEAGGEADFLSPLPVSELWGVGKATLASLHGMGIETIGHLAEFSPETLARRLGSASALHLSELAAGRDPRSVETSRSTKSISVENTFASDLVEVDDIEFSLLELCHRLSGRLRRSGKGGRTVTLKVRFADFTTLTRSATLSDAVIDTTQLWATARELLAKAEVAGRGVRLLGIGVANFAGEKGGEAEGQLSLESQPAASAMADAASEVRERFGDDALRPARLARPVEKNPKG